MHVKLEKTDYTHAIQVFNPLKAKGRLLYLNAQSVPRSKHFSTLL
jgi:hypothetical protein